MTARKTHITFVLPSLSYVPSGGFKIVYEYANRLNKIGYKINLIHPNIVEYDLSGKKNINISDRVRYYYRRLKENRITGSWFPIDKNINNYFIPEINDQYIPNSDIIIATGWQTAKPVLDLDKSKGKKFYFLQSLENWAGPEKDVINTWKYPMHKIVISKWLLEFADSINEKADYIPNGLNYDLFTMDVIPEHKKKNSILMMVSNSNVKGTKYGLDALLKLKEIESDVDVTLFGTDNYEYELPAWIKFNLNPSQELLKYLYNSSSVFLSPSLMEGFPLPPAEAMMCGCALAASDIGGHKEYAVNEKNSLLFRSKDINDTLDVLLKYIYKDELRCKLAYQGNKDIQNYKWDTSVNSISELFSNIN